MIAMLLGLPSWLKATVVGLALISVLQVRHAWEVRGLKKQIAAAAQALDYEKAANAELRVGLSDVQANRDQLEARLREQNAAIALLQARALELSASADARAANALRAGAATSSALRADTTHVPPGHEALNRWLTEQFVPR